MSRGDIVLDAHQHVLALANNVPDRREHLHTQVVDAIRQQDYPTTLQRLEELVAARRARVSITKGCVDEDSSGQHRHLDQWGVACAVH